MHKGNVQAVKEQAFVCGDNAVWVTGNRSIKYACFWAVGQVPEDLEITRNHKGV